jgi:hypothetical protein
MHFFYIAMLAAQIVGPILFYVLRLLGIGAVTYVGINLVLDEVKDYIIGNFANVPIEVQQILGLAKFDVAVNIYLAAITARLLLAGYDKATQGGAKKKWETLAA